MASSDRQNKRRAHFVYLEHNDPGDGGWADLCAVDRRGVWMVVAAV